jgi:hypothetical protein
MLPAFYEEFEDAFGEPAWPELVKLLERSRIPTKYELAVACRHAEEAKRIMGLVVWIANSVKSARPLGGDNRGWTARDADAPPWWPEHCRAVFERFRDDQRTALSVLGLDRPARIEELPSILAAKAASVRSAGRPFTLEYPALERPNDVDLDSQVVHAKSLTVFPGYDLMEDCLDTDTELGTKIAEFDPLAVLAKLLEEHPEGGPDADDAIDEAYFAYPDDFEEELSNFIKVLESPLARIAQMHKKLAKATGCQLHEATMFLLCDIPPVLPVVEFKIDESALDSTGDTTVRMIVGSTRVSGRSVAAAYEVFLDTLGTSNRVHRPRRGTPMKADAFHTALQANAGPRKRVTWQESFKAFDAVNPGIYRNWRSYAETIRRHWRQNSVK